MSLVKTVLNIFREDHTFRQRANYLKYLLSRKRDILDYDPVMISIVATSRCTLACDMCPTHSKLVPRNYPYIQKNIKDMEFRMFKDIVDRFKNAITINIIGSGEPLLNEDFFKMVDYGAKNKMVVKTVSNGTTVKDNMASLVASKLDGITISINGHNSEEFNRMTGMDKAVHSEICKATKMLVEEKKKNTSKLKVKLSFIIDSYNYKFIPDMIDLSMQLDADQTFLCNFLSCPYEGLKPEERVLMADEQIVSDIKGMIKKYPPRIRRKITLPTLISQDKIKNYCNAHFFQIRFDGDGNVSSCSMMLLNMSGQGNYGEKDVWNNNFFKTMRRRFLSGKREDLLEPCLVCPDNFGVYPWS